LFGSTATSFVPRMFVARRTNAPAQKRLLITLSLFDCGRRGDGAPLGIRGSMIFSAPTRVERRSRASA
jgi:hypothetical protein